MVKRSGLVRFNALAMAIFVLFSANVNANEDTNWLVNSFYGLLGGVAGAPISGVVVDSETGAPIEGVSVLAQWDKEGWHGAIWEHISIIEALTDKSGRYTLPSWGPKLSLVSNIALMEYPQIHFFKLGHYPLTVGEKSVLIHGEREIDRLNLTSSWGGETIPLVAMKQKDLEEYADIVSSHIGTVNIYIKEFGGVACYRELFPKAIESFMVARRYFIKEEVSFGIGDYERRPSTCD